MQPLNLLSESSLLKKAASSRSANTTVFYSPCKKFLNIFSNSSGVPPLGRRGAKYRGQSPPVNEFSSIRHSDANKTLLSTLKDLCFSSIDAELQICLQLAVNTNSALRNKASRL